MPAARRTQLSCFGDGFTVPGAHSVALAEPTGQKVPSGQSKHCSALVNTDERDRAALRAAAKLASIVNGDDGAAGAPTEAEQRRLAGALATKAWERRDDVRRVSRRLARELLQQTASRMTTT